MSLWLRQLCPDNIIMCGFGPGLDLPFITAQCPSSRIVAFDPFSQEQEGVELIKLALAEKSCRLPLYKTSRTQLTSRFAKGVLQKPTLVSAISLDEYTHHLNGTIGLWMDCEGSEVAILRGATQTLQRTLWIVAEMPPVINRRRGWPSLQEAETTLRDAGFERECSVYRTGDLFVPCKE